MYIIYHCVGGAHSSVIASAIHLGLLSIDKRPTVKDILALPFFDTLSKEDQGRIILRGIDKDGNKVCSLSRQFVPHLILTAVQDAWELAGGSRKDLVIVNSMPAVNILMKIGGFSSRRLKLVSFGRPIVAKGTVRAYDDLVKIVKEAKKLLNNR